MKRLIIALLAAAAALFAFSATTFAAPQSKPAKSGPFEGTFSGLVTGDSGSKALLTLDLTDRNNRVAGTAEIGSGLKLNAGGICGIANLPAGTFDGEGLKSSKHPRNLSLKAPVSTGSFDVMVEVEGRLSADGEKLLVTATVDTPWICGRDPVIQGTLDRLD